VSCNIWLAPCTTDEEAEGEKRDVEQGTHESTADKGYNTEKSKSSGDKKKDSVGFPSLAAIPA
jgi:hypothetical protein